MASEMGLTGWEAFDAIGGLLALGRRPQATLEVPLFCRIERALDMGPRPSTLDLAVLVRQVLRFQTLQNPGGEPARLVVRQESGWPTASDWQRVGVEAKVAEGGYRLEAFPWEPDWLPDAAPDGVDAAAAGAVPRRSVQRVPGDPLLGRFRGFRGTEYLSPGQRAAVRAALTTPPGATLLVCLPTGEGKSLAFQTVAEFGFGDGGPATGVTLVVTPTVALALDHQRAAIELGMLNIPRAFVGGSQDSNNEIASRIAAGTQGLCFASPEAVCGTLRASLIRAARDQSLRALVIDEAHLVDAWGAEFRPEFQLLSGLRRDLLHAIGPGPHFRTFLLSATVSDQTVTTLRKLFSSQDTAGLDKFAVCGTVGLRPEIDYWVTQTCTQAEQQQRALEAIHHLPRPMILYLTRVREADSWHRRLREGGFQRLACVTGQTPAEERRRVVTEWRAGAIDLVVATSAFGLGIDNQDVRAVIHACVPETLDRFYQEVGRAGRDGRACISLVIPTADDLQTAGVLNRKRLISSKRGLERWRAMWEHSSRIPHGGDLFTVRLDVPPGIGRRDIDMVGEESTAWNARTLSLMAGAGLISLQGHRSVDGVPPQESDADGEGSVEWHPAQTVKVLNKSHLDLGTWEECVEGERERLKSAFRLNLELMKRYLLQQDCMADLLAPLYELHEPTDGALLIPVSRACGGCPACRRGERSPWHDPPSYPSPPWKGSAPGEPIASLLGHDNRLLVVCPRGLLGHTGSSELSIADRRRFGKVLSTLIDCGMRNLLLLPGVDISVQAMQKDLKWVVFIGDPSRVNQLPKGPAVVIAPPGAAIAASELRKPRQPDEARVFFLSEDHPDPDRTNVRFCETNSGRQFRLADLQRRLGQ